MEKLYKINHLQKHNKNKEKWEINIWLLCGPCQRKEMKIILYIKILNK